MLNLINNILSTGPSSLALGEDYSEICGDASEAGFVEARGNFAAYLAASALKHMTEASADDGLLRRSWRSFLIKKGGCPKGAANRGLFEASSVRRRARRTALDAETGLKIASPAGEILVGFPSSMFGSASIPKGPRMILFASEAEAKDPENAFPMPMRLERTAILDGEAVPFDSVLSAAGIAVVRSDDFSLQLFAGGGYLGSVNLVEAIADESAYASAWNRYLKFMLRRAQETIGVLDSAIAVGWENLLPDERGELVSSLARLAEAHAAGSAFNIGNDEHPLEKTYSYVFGRAQLAKIGNAMMSAAVLIYALSHDDANAELMAEARNHLLTLLDPFDHLEKSFVSEPLVHPYLTIGLPANMPKVKAENPIALRQMIDEIVYRAGMSGVAGKPNSISFNWDETLGRLSVEGSKGNMSSLADFAEDGDAYLTVKSPWTRLYNLASRLGEGGAITYGHRGGSETPYTISITVPLAGEAERPRKIGGIARGSGAKEVVSVSAARLLVDEKPLAQGLEKACFASGVTTTATTPATAGTMKK